MTIRTLMDKIHFINEISLLIIIQIFLSALSVFAKEDETLTHISTHCYTENDAIEMALKSNRKTKSLQTNVQIADIKLKYGNWIRSPELRISDISTRYFTEEFEEYNIGLRWRFRKLGEASKLKQDAMVDYWDAKIQEILYRHNLIARVRRSFADVRMYEKLAELAENKVAVETKRLDIVEHMMNLGERSVVYRTKAKMWHAESKNNLARMKQRKNLARLKLLKLTGISETDQLIFNEIPEMNQTFEYITQLAIENRPEIRLINQRIDLASKRSKYEKLQLFPWFTFIEGSYHKEKKQANDWTEIRLGMTIPFFNPNAASIKSTQLAVEKKESELDAIYEQIEEEVRDAYTLYMDLMLDWKNFYANANQLIEEADAIADQASLHQTLMPDEVLELELTIIETQSLLEEKRNRLMQSFIDLEKMVGVENLTAHISEEND